MSKIRPIPPGSTEIVDESDRFKIAQAIYSAVTGKTEKLSRTYSKDYLITLDDIQQLHLKCQQACGQWTVLNKSESITVHHLDDNKEVFSSYKRFSIYDHSKTSPTESIVYEFNLLLQLPKVEKPQHYKVVVRTLSRAAMIRRMEQEMAPPPLLSFFGSSSIVVDIEYVDYVVARNILGMIDSWVSEIERHSNLWWIRHIQRFTHWVPPVSQFLAIAFIGLSLFTATAGVIVDSSPPPLVARWLILSGTVIALTALLARRLGSLVESGLDQILTLSAIQLNKGDQRLIQRYRNRNILKVIQVLGGVVGVTAHAVGANFLTDWLKLLIHK
ncbi:hypothetical protein JIN85_19260 [Luteolibacter pohnpeiensis]|uniref:Uncharacterized protein n=1 Tax=Luteolibacter pohnpeiensis TaxID=454153 RepID=A0A934S9Z7_9BACT|nr:hypothetical protein [Luteolibacter pohnpeiensis]MBK1884563.1 hypothetical protein [Luteolibacter pohnpeiensis]